jgi:hypothetical protein
VEHGFAVKRRDLRDRRQVEDIADILGFSHRVVNIILISKVLPKYVSLLLTRVETYIEKNKSEIINAIGEGRRDSFSGPYHTRTHTLTHNKKLRLI